MSGLKRHRSNFTERPVSGSSSSDDNVYLNRPSKRKANVYDAVAGRVTQAGLIGNVKDAKASKQRLRPDEVLFKQANAPVRYEETDYYLAHENLQPGQELPSGALLNALHAYTSKLFSRTAEPGTEKAWRCMDETALIAFGILMEETAREKLGDTGDLAFTEAAEEDEESTSTDREDQSDGKSTRRSSMSQAVGSAGDVKLDLLSSSGDESSYSTDESD